MKESEKSRTFTTSFPIAFLHELDQPVHLKAGFGAEDGRISEKENEIQRFHLAFFHHHFLLVHFLFDLFFSIAIVTHSQLVTRGARDAPTFTTGS